MDSSRDANHHSAKISTCFGAGKKINDICLSSDQTFIFFFEVDRSYMLFAANDKDWPVMLNTEKVSLQRNSIVEFPQIGSGKFVTYGPHELMLKVGGYMTEKIDDPDFDVKDLDITKVIQDVISEKAPTRQMINIMLLMTRSLNRSLMNL